MARDHATLHIENENNRDAGRSLDETIEMIFGKPNAPNAPKNNTDSVHMLDSERRHNNSDNGNNNVSESDTEHPLQPLLEPDRDRQTPPLAGPEVDELDGDRSRDAAPFPFIDDGLLNTGDKKPEIIITDSDDAETGLAGSDGGDHTLDLDGVGPDDMNGLSPRFGADDRPMSPMPGVIAVDLNTYQQKKNLAQGMMDLALLSANANQLRYVLESSTTHPYYYSSLTFISLSIIFQIVVGVGLILNSQYDVNVDKDVCKADKINNMTVLGIFLITVVNVFITSFSVATNPTVMAPQQMG